jgi:glutamate/tyrosine decarboxylase-like PLP-dependent enzyme
MFRIKVNRLKSKIQLQTNKDGIPTAIKITGATDKEIEDFINDINKILDTSKSPFTIREVCE